MTNITNTLTSSELADIVHKIFKVKGEIQLNEGHSFAQVHFDVTSLSANKVRKLNRIVYEKTDMLPEWSTMISSGHCLNNPTILVHLHVME